MKKVEYTNLRARPGTKRTLGRQVETSNQDSGNTHGTLKIMTLAWRIHYIYITADMNMVTLKTL